MATLTDNTWVVDPEDGSPKFLKKGHDVPSWAEDQVGDHLLKGGVDAEPTVYGDQSVKDLEAEIERRNAGRHEEDHVVPTGTGKNGAVVKADLVAALEADDEKHADDADGAGGEQSE